MTCQKPIDVIFNVYLYLVEIKTKTSARETVTYFFYVIYIFFFSPANVRRINKTQVLSKYR